MLDLQPYFNAFIQRVSLGDPQVPRINAVSLELRTFLAQSYGIALAQVFEQGSYPNGTAVEPTEGGEYDLDLVCVCVGVGVTAEAALNDLERRFLNDPRYRGRLKPGEKKPCVRLQYPEDDVGAFHVDVVPCFPTGASPPGAPLQAPRRGEGWHDTNPAAYTNWCKQQGDSYSRTVKAMKRWRDFQQPVRQAIKSIVLQVLVSQHMPQLGSDAYRLAATFRSLHAALEPLDAPPAVYNPVLKTENLAARWTEASFRSFKQELAEAVEWVGIAQGAADTVEAADAWRELLGEDFPNASANSLGFVRGSLSHAQAPSEMGWAEALDPAYGVSITAQMQRSKRTGRRRRLDDDGDLVFAGHMLRFEAHLRAPRSVDVWWQVANTGGHARAEGALRGEILRAKGPNRGSSPDQKINWENTAYTGPHEIRALAVRNDAVVARSDWFTVNVYAPRVPFKP